MTAAAEAAPLSAREETVDHLVEALHCMVRDGHCTGAVAIDGLTLPEWKEIEANEVTAWMKVESFKDESGSEIGRIIYLTDHQGQS